MAATTATTKDLYVTLPLEVHMRLRVAAGARGLTYAQYIERLVELHLDCRAVYPQDTMPAADRIADILARVGLETVTT